MSAKEYAMENESDVRGTGEVASTLWAKVLVTLLALGVCAAGYFIKLPNFNYDAQGGGQSSTSWTIMSLGLGPLLIAFILVELFASVAHHLQPLRVGGPAARAGLRRAAIILGLIIASGQAFVLAVGAERLGVVTHPDVSSRLLTLVTLLGTTAGLLLLADLVDRYGLGNGMSVLILASFIPVTLQVLGKLGAHARGGMSDSEVLLTSGLVVAGLVAATLWMFSPYRLRIHGSLSSTLPVLLPACGIVPIVLVPAVLSFLSSIAHILNVKAKLPLKPFADAIQPAAAGYLPVAILLAVAAAVLFSWLFNWPERVANSCRLFSAASIPVKALVKAAAVESCLFVILALLGAHWLNRLLGPASVALVLPVVVGTGILLDLVREARFRVARANAVAVWEIHQLYAVDPAMRLLAGEGIVAFPRGLHLRTLLQFFGPFVPVHILVEPEQAQLARALLQSRWGTIEKSASGAGKAPPSLPTARPPVAGDSPLPNPPPARQQQGTPPHGAFIDEMRAEWEHVKEKCPHCGSLVCFTSTICPTCGQSKIESPPVS